MDPLTLAMLGSTAISTIGNFMGAGEASKTQSRNREIDAQNFQQRERERQEALEFARQALAQGERGFGYADRGIEFATRGLEDAKKGMDDGLGGRVWFDPEHGWTTQAAPERHAELGMADQYLRELKNVQRPDPARTESVLYDAATHGLNESNRNITGAAMTSALRSGNTNTGAILAQLAKTQGDQYAKAGLEAEIRAPEIAQQRYDQQRGQAAQLYKAFTDLGNRPVGAGSPIPQFANQAASLAGAQAQAALGGANVAMKAGDLGMNAAKIAQGKGGEHALEQPNMGTANAIASLGGSLGGIFQGMQSRDRYGSALSNAFRQFDMPQQYDTSAYKRNQGAQL